MNEEQVEKTVLKEAALFVTKQQSITPENQIQYSLMEPEVAQVEAVAVRNSAINIIAKFKYTYLDPMNRNIVWESIIWI